MPLIRVYTLDENIEHTKLIIQLYEDMTSSLQDAFDIESDFFKNQVSSPAFLESRLRTILASVESIISELNTLIVVFSSVLHIWPPVVDKTTLIKPDYLLTGIAVDVDNGAGKSTLTRVQIDNTSIFNVFDAADVVQISNAEDSSHNGFHTVDSSSVSVLTFDTTMSGSDNSLDETMIVRLYKRVI